MFTTLQRFVNNEYRVVCSRSSCALYNKLIVIYFSRRPNSCRTKRRCKITLFVHFARSVPSNPYARKTQAKKYPALPPDSPPQPATN